MKKLLVVMLVLAMANIASAEAIMYLDISESEVKVGAELNINVVTDPIDGDIAMGDYFIAVTLDSVGDAAFNIDNAVIEYPGIPSSIDLDSEFAEDLDLRDNYVRISLSDSVGDIDPVVGAIVSDIKMKAVTEGAVTIRVFDGDGTQHGGDYEITVGVPEPITIGLLGLGALFLRRRK